MLKQYLNGYSNYQIPYLDISGYFFNKEILKIIKKQLAIKYCAIPLDIFENILTVTLGIPTLETVNILEKSTKKIVRIFKSDKEEIIKTINQLY